MRCPFCGETDTRVADSRLSEPGDVVRRRRRCPACDRRFTTYERYDQGSVFIRKSSFSNRSVRVKSQATELPRESGEWRSDRVREQVTKERKEGFDEPEE